MNSINRFYLFTLTLLLLSVPCTSVRAQCDTAPINTRPCDDGDPCTDNDEETFLVADGSICIPCAGTLADCANGPTSIVVCDDGDASTGNDVQTILNCDGTICVPCAGVLLTPCDAPAAQIDLQANAVRARLTTNGSLWNGTYEVTADENSPNLNPVSAIFNGVLWIGGRKPDGELFVRAPRYGTGPGNYGYQPGPFIDGQTSAEICARWDRFFTSNSADVRLHRRNADETEANFAFPIPLDEIPASILGWPASGNPHFESVHGFPLHNASDGLAPYWDSNTDGYYDPAQGDFPLFCGDEASWAVFNTGNTTGDGVFGQADFQIEVMAYAFDDPDNDLRRTTFYNYKIKYQFEGQETLSDFYVGHFIDSDLGCFENDRADSAPERGLFYVYNDQPTEGACTGGVPGYGNTAPVNVFQVLGARFSNFMSDDTTGMQQYNTFYSANDGPLAMLDPSTSTESYNYLSGKWRDGTPITRGGNGYNPGSDNDVTRFAYDGVETDGTPWRSCNAGVPALDIRNIYSIGPHLAQPGSVSSFTLAVTTLFGVDYAGGSCPDRDAIIARADVIREVYNDACSRRALQTVALRPEPASAIQLEVFPNPTSNLLTFRLPEGERTKRLELLDLTGRVVLSVIPNNRDFTVNVAGYGLVPGSYFYRLYTTSDRLVTGKVIVRP